MDERVVCRHGIVLKGPGASACSVRCCCGHRCDEHVPDDLAPGCLVPECDCESFVPQGGG